MSEHPFPHHVRPKFLENLAAIVASLLLLLTAGGVQATVLDRIVAVVEAQTVSKDPVKPRIITQSEVDEVARPILNKLRASGEKVDAEKVRKRVLEELVMRALRDQKAAELDIKVTEEDILALFSQVERNNKLPPGSLPEALRSQGIDVERYRQSLHDQILRTRLINRRIRPQVRVADEEIDLLMRNAGGGGAAAEVRLGQVLLHVEASESPIRVQAMRHQAEELVAQLREGASLSSIAGQFSNDPSGLSGGDMGWFKRGQLQPELEKAVFDQKKGAIAGPIRSPQGFHIFQVLDRRSVDSGSGIDTNLRTKVKARHILLKLTNEDGPEKEAATLEAITAILEKINGGADFSEMAKKHSEDSTAEEGGDLGWFGEGSMVPSFEAAAFALEKGQTSKKPVRTPFGWHLIRLDDKKVIASDSYEAKRKELEQRILEAKVNAGYEQWLRDLRSRAFVEFR